MADVIDYIKRNKMCMCVWFNKCKNEIKIVISELS